MKNATFSSNVVNGLISGIVSGAVFTIFLVKKGMLPVLGNMIHTPTVAGGLIVHTMMSLVVGVLFALVLHKVVKSMGMGILFGILTGVAMFLAGPMTMMPTMIEHLPLFAKWNAEGFAAAKDVLMGHVVYGVILGAVFAQRNK